MKTLSAVLLFVVSLSVACAGGPNGPTPLPTPAPTPQPPSTPSMVTITPSVVMMVEGQTVIFAAGGGNGIYLFGSMNPYYFEVSQTSNQARVKMIRRPNQTDGISVESFVPGLGFRSAMATINVQ